MLDLALIRIDGGTQIRAELNQATVDIYAEAYAAGAVFPPVTVFFDGKDRWLADGFHRFFAAKKAGKASILEEITPGTKRDAILFSLGANGVHGLNRTNADKRNAVATMLSDPEWMAWSNVAIAKACAVSEGFVRSLRINEVTAPSERTYITKHGTTAKMRTGDIGAAPREPIDEKGRATSDRAIDAAIHQPTPRTEPQTPLEVPDSDEPPEYTELDAANDQISDLQAELVVARMGDIPEEEKTQAAGLITELRAEIKSLCAQLAAVTASRDFLMGQETQMKKQIAAQRREIDKLKAAAQG